MVDGRFEGEIGAGGLGCGVRFGSVAEGVSSRSGAGGGGVGGVGTSFAGAGITGGDLIAIEGLLICGSKMALGEAEGDKLPRARMYGLELRILERSLLTVRPL